MRKFWFRLYSSATIASLLLAAGFWKTTPLYHAANTLLPSVAVSPGNQVVDEGSPPACSSINPITKGMKKERRATAMAQLARSTEDWNFVINEWIQAIEDLQAIPADSPKRIFAQKKIAEYINNLELAYLEAVATTSSLPFSSFDNEIFDQQLRLYLSYIAAVGRPDILIVGSSRALQGLDPQQLQKSLGMLGKGELKVFNFGVNGATAQFVDFQLRQLLTPEQLPRLVIWADGVRAFNSGRVDRTYQSLVASEGYKRLLAGDRPKLPKSQKESANTCQAISESTISSVTNKLYQKWAPETRLWATATLTSNRQPRPCNLDPATCNLQLVSKQLTPANTGYSTFAINANGFLPMNGTFNPKIYYRSHPRVSGRYDADYQPFSFAGKQTTAVNAIKSFLRKQNIPLVVVNLPLTKDYLDPVRLSREQKLQQWMLKQTDQGFIFIDMGRQWLNQNQYFADPSHLNQYGAAAVASELAANPQIPWP
ncbi:MAG: hypothetical protein F6J90_28620 [Moorea sp. SIOASIH]|uniref:hypothetical protein n=1 Tax=Moorena sp. SIOASIH TaxID=2607817 RepID=UPI0013B76560|nr:hypothetical protein [Moorena sp. SIOASIH]NEO40088.1 hypothetical protein [Moorena sp. SIOASIH]